MMSEQPKNQQPAAAPIDEPLWDSKGNVIHEAVDRLGAARAPSPADERAAFVKLMGYDRPETEGVAVDVWDSQRTTWLEALAFARAASANETGAQGAPRYAEWLHLRAHGEWPNGVPEWARDYTGRMNDFTAATAVIEELAALASRAPAQAAEPVAVVRVGNLPHGPFSFDTTPHGVDTLSTGLHKLYTVPAQAEALVTTSSGWQLVPVDPTIEMCDVMRVAVNGGWSDSMVWAKALAAAPQHRAQADALPEIDPPQAGGNKGRLPALARTREGGNLYSLGYNRGLKKGRDEAAQPAAREGLTDEQREAVEFVIGWCEQCTLADNPYRAHITALRALLQGANHAE
jgi:hypothetical protein